MNISKCSRCGIIPKLEELTLSQIGVPIWDKEKNVSKKDIRIHVGCSGSVDITEN